MEAKRSEPWQENEAPRSWVYRDVKHVRPASELVRELEHSLAELETGRPDCSQILDPLLRCGELECGLADYGSSEAAIACELTDCVANVLVSRDTLALRTLESHKKYLPRLSDRSSVSVSAPEGFAYYALHPLDLVEAARRLPDSDDPVAIIGIRSIGTVLSAVVASALKAMGDRTSRTSTRPSGHPYDRKTRFTDKQIAWIRGQQVRHARFVIVDEGPGLSGSSFLSVAEALLKLAVPEERILLLGSRPTDPEHLCASNAKQRWQRFQFRAAEPVRYKAIANGADISGGQWRERLLPPRAAWPACWPEMERLKFLSQERKWILKFEGIGRWGRENYHRSIMLGDAGFSPLPERIEEGMVSYPVMDRSPASPELNAATVKRLAEYCAYRAKTFQVNVSPDRQLEEMIRFNAEQELGSCPDLDSGAVCTGTVVIADGRMQPHEWILCTDGRLLKVDAVSHGDDHFFPGPVDVAWDLAGAIVEWNMPAFASRALLRNFLVLSGDDARRRIPVFVFAYSVFRMAYNRLALTSVADPHERARLLNEHRRYKVRAESVLQSSDFEQRRPADDPS